MASRRAAPRVGCFNLDRHRVIPITSDIILTTSQGGGVGRRVFVPDPALLIYRRTYASRLRKSSEISSSPAGGSDLKPMSPRAFPGGYQYLRMYVCPPRLSGYYVIYVKFSGTFSVRYFVNTQNGHICNRANVCSPFFSPGYHVGISVVSIF